MDILKYNPFALNRRLRREMAKIGYRNITRIPLADCSAKLVHIMTDHHGRVMRNTPAGRLKAIQKQGRKIRRPDI